jgi:hypothetical protein
LSSAFDLLTEAFSGLAEYKVTFERDKSDSFTLALESLTEDLPDSYELDKTDVLPLLPSGSNWSQAEGWRSFFGIPCRFDENERLAIGLVEVKSHEQRGAYPVSSIFLTEINDSYLPNVFDRLVQQLKGVPGDSKELAPHRGAVRGTASTPDEYLGTELRILRRAREAYAKEERLLFRTAVLTENNLPPFSFLNVFNEQRDSELPFDYRSSLYGTIPSIYRTFSWSSRLKVMLDFNLSFRG